MQTPDSLANVNREIRQIESQLAMHWSSHAAARLDALEDKRDELRAEQIQREGTTRRAPLEQPAAAA